MQKKRRTNSCFSEKNGSEKNEENTSDVHVVGDADVCRAPAELPGVGGQHEDVVAGLPRSVKQRKGDFVVVTHVQLEEPRTPCVASIGTLSDVVQTAVR